MGDHELETESTNKSTGTSPVLFMTVTSLQEADIVRSILAQAGIEAFMDNENITQSLSILGTVVNPNGIRVRVRPQDIEAAQVALDHGRQASVDLDPVEDDLYDDDSDEVAFRRSPANAHACSAFYMSLFTMVFICLVPMTILIYSRARAAAKQAPPIAPRRYRRHMAFALLLISLQLLFLLYFAGYFFLPRL